MDSIPPICLTSNRDLIIKSENAKKIPLTCAQEIVAILQAINKTVSFKMLLPIIKELFYK
jgi:hypothetical protein